MNADHGDKHWILFAISIARGCLSTEVPIVIMRVTPHPSRAVVHRRSPERSLGSRGARESSMSIAMFVETVRQHRNELRVAR